MEWLHVVDEEKVLEYEIRQQDDDQIMKEVLGHGKQVGLYSVR